MVWQKVIATLVLVSSVGFVGRAIQQSLLHTDSSPQLIATAELQQTSDLIPVLLNDKAAIREQAFKKLQSLDVSVSVPALVQALKDKDWQIQVIAAYTLGRLGTKAEPAISELNSTIKDENADVRISAAQALGNIVSEKVVPELIQALQDKDENLRVSAAGALSKLGATAKPAGLALTKALWDGNWFVRRRVTKTLAVLGSTSIDIPALVEPLKDSREPDNGAIISLMIGIYPAVLEKPELCSQFFIKALRSKDPGVRQSAAIALGQIRSTRFAVYDSQLVTGALLLALKDQNTQVRSRAAQALGRFARFGRGKSVATLGVIETQSALLAMFNDENAQVRSSVVEALRNTLWLSSYDGVPDPTPALATKITSEAARLLKDQDTRVRQNAIGVLSAISNKNYTPSIKTQLSRSIYSYLVDLLYDTDEGVRQKTLNTLSSLDEQYKVGFSGQLISIIERKDVDKEIRRSLLASGGSGLAGSVNGLAALNNALQDEDPGVRQNAALSLYKAERMNKETAIDVLSKGFNSDDPLTQLDAINGLSQIIGRGSISFRELDKKVSAKILSELPNLNRCLQSPIKPIQWGAALAINKIDSKQESTIPALREILEVENDWTLRETASGTLQEIDSPQAALAMAEASKLENQEFIYARTCSNTYIPLPQKQRVLLVESLRNETTRQILAENLEYFAENESAKNQDSNRNATVNALILLLQKENRKPSLKPILELKGQDIRGSVAYSMGNFLSSEKKSGTANKKIIDALAKVMNDSSDNLDVRWMAATSLQNAGIKVDNFFEQNKVVNPKNIKCPFPLEGRNAGLSFDRYEGRCLYDTRTGCGDGLAEVYNTLRSLLAGGNRNNGSNNINKK
jgi:HEAT repeat protein